MKALELIHASFIKEAMRVSRPIPLIDLYDIHYMSRNIKMALVHRVPKTNKVILLHSPTTCKDNLAAKVTKYVEATRKYSHNQNIMLFVRVSLNEHNYQHILNEGSRAVINGHAFLNKVEEKFGWAKSTLYSVNYDLYSDKHKLFYKEQEWQEAAKLKLYCVTLNKKWAKSIIMIHLAIMLIRMGEEKKLCDMPVEKAFKAATSMPNSHSAFFRNHVFDMRVFNKHCDDILLLLKNADTINKGFNIMPFNPNYGVMRLFTNKDRPQFLEIMYKRLKDRRTWDGKEL